MQNSSAGLRMAARLLVLALSSFVLVVMGCTGAQAIPDTPAPATLSVLAPAAQMPPDAAADARSVPSAGQELTACHPGRDRVRLERNSMAPGQGLFQPGPELSGSALSRMTHPDFDSLQLAGRIPAALTHLDLGIVRT